MRGWRIEYRGWNSERRRSEGRKRGLRIEDGGWNSEKWRTEGRGSEDGGSSIEDGIRRSGGRMAKFRAKHGVGGGKCGVAQVFDEI
jgi:hypothetical protein